MSALPCGECTPLQTIGFWLLIVTVIALTIWVVRQIIASIRAALRRYPFPEAHYQAIVSQIQQALHRQQITDGYARRITIMQTMDTFAETYPEVDVHRKEIWQRLEEEAW